MLRSATADEIGKVAGPLWTLVNSASWGEDYGVFDPVKCGALSIIAHLAYCEVGADEAARKVRAKVVPCTVYNRLIEAGSSDVREGLAGMDFPDVATVRTRNFIAAIIPVRDIWFIGVRGTQFAYDWLINIDARKSRKAFQMAAGGVHPFRVHAGFYNECMTLQVKIREALLHAELIGLRLPKAIYLAGHSLGGAIAGLLYSIKWDNLFPAPIQGCYVFGAPRVCDKEGARCLDGVLALRRPLDIVPHCPPRLLGYRDFPMQIDRNGALFQADSRWESYKFATWIASLRVGSFLKHHCMEAYRKEALEAVGLQEA